MRSGSASTRLAVLLSGALVASLLAPVVGAQAAGPSTVNTTVFYTGTTTTWTVPVGVTSINLTVTGGQGGIGGNDATITPPGGYQGVVAGTLSVTPGQVLTIGVGAGGANGTNTSRGSNNSALYTVGAAVGGASPLGYAGGNGGVAGYTGSSGFGGAGGAATVVSTAGSTIVAGGAGGTGGSGQYPATMGRISSATYTGRSDATSTVGQTGITIAYVCQIAGASCDGGGGAGGGGGVQGGAQGAVQFGSGTSNEWFGYGGYPGQSSTAGLAGLTAAYQFYPGNGANGSVSISYAAGGPSAPTNVAGVAADSSVPLTWNAPTALGGSAITDYAIDYTLASTPTAWVPFTDGTSTATSTTVTGLTNGTAYLFRVTGSNASGAGLTSSNSASVTPSGPPAAPSITTISPADGALSVAFAAATSVAPILDYEYQLGGTGPWLSTGSTTSPVVLSGLHNGTTYAVTLHAVNAIGNGPASAPVNGTPAGAPGAPSITSVSATPGTATVGFTAGYAGGAAITDYQYQLGGGSWVSAGTTSSPITISGLAAGTTYAIKLRAVTASSTGAASTASSVTTPDVPSAPSISLVPGDSSLAVAFSPPNNRGAVISSYEYQVGVGSWTAAPSLASPIIVTGLTNGTSYGVRLRAVNAVGTGSPSATVNGTPATVPGAPTIVGGTVAGSDTQLSADFTAPASDGGSAITTYQYSTDAGATWRARDAGTTGTPVVIATLSSDGTTSLVNGTQYQVELRAVNAVGAGAASSLATGIAATSPSAPTVTSVTPGNTTLQVAFTPGGNGGAAVTGYQYQLGGVGPWVGTGSLSGALAITGLSNGTSYAVTVRAVNAQGNGTASAPVSGTPVTTPAQPSIAGVSRADQSLTLTVSEPDAGGSAVTGWQYSTDGGATWATAAQSSSPLTITRLSLDGTTLIANGTSYPVTVRAINAIGASIGSPTTTIGPSASPSAPVITLTPLDQALRVAFPAPADGGSPISALEYQLGSGAWTDAGTLVSPFLLSGLTNGTSYTVRLRADNVVGPGTSSSPVAATPRTVPDAPTAVTAAVGSAQAVVAWTAPADNGGSAITSYVASAYPSAVSSVATATCTTAATGCAITGLTNTTTYYVSVVAANVAGSGVASAPRVAVTPMAPPGAPTLSSLTAGNTTLALAFSAGSAGSSAITDYQYQLSGGSWISAGTTASPITVSGLTNGTSYAVVLRAVSAVGVGASSGTLTATPYNFPDPPSAVAADGRNASADVTWAAPNNNGSAITSYTATAFSAAAAGTQIGTCTTTTLACTITGLTNGTTYYVSLQAGNAAGLSVRSTPRVAVTPSLLPGVVSAVTAVAGNASAQLAWTPGSTGGSSVTDYTVWYSSGGAYTQFADGVSTATSATVTGLTNGSTYTFKIYPVNGSGTGAASAPSNAVTPLAPGTVPTLSATSSRAGGFSFTVTNYSAGTTYSFAATNGGTATISAGTVTVTGLASGASSTVTVTAAKTGETTTAAVASGAALLAGAPPTFSAATRTVSGFSFQISNFVPAATYTITPSVGSATSSGSTVTVSGLGAGQTSIVTVGVSQSGYTDASAAKTGAALGAGTTPTFSALASTVDGFTFTIANYSASLTYSFTGTNAAVVSNSGGSVTVTGLAPGGSSLIGVTAVDPGLSTATATTSGSALLSGVAPAFSTPVRTVDGYTASISNYLPAATYTATSSAGTAVTSSGSLVVYGLSPGQSADVTVSVARSGYTDASGWLTAAALDAGTTPTISGLASTVDGFMFAITNYSASLTYTFTGTNAAVVSNTGGSVLVTGLARGGSSLIGVTAVDPGLSTATATTSGSALLSGVAPMFSAATRTAGGFSFQISNFVPAATYTITPSAGSATSLGSTVTVSGLSAGQTSDVTVGVVQSGYTDASGWLTAAALDAGTTPTFSALTSTADGFTFTIANYSTSLTYSFTGTNTAVVSRTGAAVTVTGLAPGASSDITVGAMDPGASLALGLVSGTALLAGASPTFTTPVSGATSWTTQISNYVPTAVYTATATLGTVSRSGATVTVSALTPAQSSDVTVTVSRPGYTGAFALVTGAALTAGVTPDLSTPVPVEFGFTFTINNYQPGLVYTLIGTNGATVTRTGSSVAVSGLADGQTSQITVAASDPGISVSSAAVDGTAATPSSPVPTFSAPVPTADGYTFDITNYDSSGNYQLSVLTGGGSVVRNGGQVTVSGLAVGATSSVLVAVQVNGRPAASSPISGTAVAAPLVTPTPSATSTLAPTETTAPTTPETTAPTTAPTTRPTRATPTPVSTPTATRTTSPAPATTSTTSIAPRTTSASPASAGSTGESGSSGHNRAGVGSATSGASASVGGKAVSVTSTSSGTSTTFLAGNVTMRMSALVNGHEMAQSSSGAITVTAEGQLAVAVSGFRPGTVATVWSPNASALHQVLKIDLGSRATGSFALPASMSGGMQTVSLTGTAKNGATVTLQVHIMLASAAARAVPVKNGGRPAPVHSVASSAGAKSPTASAGSAGSAGARRSAGPAPSAPAVVATAPLAARPHHTAGWWWFGLGAATVAGVCGWFFLVVRRRNDDEDEQLA